MSFTPGDSHPEIERRQTYFCSHANTLRVTTYNFYTMADQMEGWRRNLREWALYLMDLLYRVRAEREAKAETVLMLQGYCENFYAENTRLRARVAELEAIIEGAQALHQLRDVDAENGGE